MHPVGACDRGPYERRRTPRVGLTVPVYLARPTVEHQAVCYGYAGQSQDLSTGGVYLITGREGSVMPGEMLKVSIAIPPKARRVFPFSRIAGDCRVIRVVAFSHPHPKQCVALEFSAKTTFLGASANP